MPSNQPRHTNKTGKKNKNIWKKLCGGIEAVVINGMLTSTAQLSSSNMLDYCFYTGWMKISEIIKIASRCTSPYLFSLWNLL